MRLMVYSHDTFGLGNIRRMLAICKHVHSSIRDSSILIVSGSPMLQSFRVEPGIDYIKLPCLKRTELGDLGVRFLDLDVSEIVRLRRELILSTVMSYRPDVVLVDKKPDGLAGELEPSLRHIKCSLSQTRMYLVLRDILDSSSATVDGPWRPKHLRRLRGISIPAGTAGKGPSLWLRSASTSRASALRDSFGAGRRGRREPGPGNGRWRRGWL